MAQLERINGRGRSTQLNPGDKVICYVSKEKAAAALAAAPKHHDAPEAPEAVAVAGAVASDPYADEAGVKDEAAVKPAVLLQEHAAKKADGAPRR
ncbi:MAG: hypothetical protein QM820_23815 [Minicystis sp.]